MNDLNIDRPFTLEVNGKFVLNPPKDTDEEHIPAKIGDRNNAAVFKVLQGRLKSGNHYMGRFHVEPLALIPMHVYWMTDEPAVQPCQNRGSDEEPRLETNGSLFAESRKDGTLYAQDRMFGPSEVKVHWQ